jgi:hypothetical protein
VFSLLNGPVAILEIDGPGGWFFAFGLCNFEVVDSFDFLDCLSPGADEVRLEFVKEDCCF